jgi:hypothetical protein
MVPEWYKGEVVIVENGVSSSEWFDMELPRNKTIVACGNHSDRKRLWWMFELIDNMPEDWRGVIVGPNVPTYLGERKHPRVTLTGEVSAHALRELYNVSTVGFHPAGEEAYALVPLEMAACGLATFVSEDCYVYGHPIIKFGSLTNLPDVIRDELTRYSPFGITRAIRDKWSWHKVAVRVEQGLEMLK